MNKPVEEWGLRSRLVAWAWGNCYACPEWLMRQPRWLRRIACRLCPLGWIGALFAGHFVDEVMDLPEACIHCGMPCSEYDNDGECIHEQCRIDRLTAKIDAEFERRRDGLADV